MEKRERMKEDKVTVNAATTTQRRRCHPLVLYLFTLLHIDLEIAK